MNLIPARRTRSFRRTLLTAMTMPVMVVAGLTVGLNLDLDQSATFKPATPVVQESLVEQHDCWTGEAPADMEGVLPGHVVIRFKREVNAEYRGSKAVGVALDHIFTAPNPDVAEVLGFCR